MSTSTLFEVEFSIYCFLCPGDFVAASSFEFGLWHSCTSMGITLSLSNLNWGKKLSFTILQIFFFQVLALKIEVSSPFYDNWNSLPFQNKKF